MTRTLFADEIAAFVRDELLNPRRSRPIVALTTQASGRFPVALDRAQVLLERYADLVALQTGDATWALTDSMPDRLDVFGGALRIYWPGLGESSNPYDHRLYLVHTERQGEEVLRIVESELRRRTRPIEESAVDVKVASLAAGVTMKAGDGRRGPLTEADAPLAAIALCLREGQHMRAVPGRTRGDGSTGFSLAGLLPSPWEVIGAALEVGDVVFGRVLAVKERYALVEILPGAKGIVSIAEVDWGFVGDIGDFLDPGTPVAVEILDLDAKMRKAQLSVKRAQTSGEPRPSPSLVPGGPPFDWKAFLRGESASSAPPPPVDDGRAEALSDELEAVNADRAALRRQVIELKASLRSAEDSRQALERRLAPELDPLCSERAFLTAVRVAYARDAEEGDRFDFPLLRLRVGPEFLARARAVEGIGVDKIVEVAGQSACDKAHAVSGREAHPLRAGPGGSAQRSRQRDDAKAWRCALQVGTPSARRLHWWRIPGPDGATIEFASVGLHDDTSIPE